VLFPEDPHIRTSLWSSLLLQLSSTEMCFLLMEGSSNLRTHGVRLSQRDASFLIGRLMRADICRLSASHGNLVSPHFAATATHGEAILTDLITYPSMSNNPVSDEQLHRDMETAAASLLFAPPRFAKVRIPLQIPLWTSREAKLSQGSGHLIFTRP
jgi:hypothetical protein